MFVCVTYLDESLWVLVAQETSDEAEGEKRMLATLDELGVGAAGFIRCETRQHVEQVEQRLHLYRAHRDTRGECEQPEIICS